jgi:hypothetical protein
MLVVELERELHAADLGISADHLPEMAPLDKDFVVENGGENGGSDNEGTIKSWHIYNICQGCIHIKGDLSE